MGEGLFFISDDVTSYSKKIGGEEIEGLTKDLDDLQTAMDAIDASAWTDKAGQGFKGQFDKFIFDAKKMNDSLLKHSQFTGKYADRVEQAESTYSAAIK